MDCEGISIPTEQWKRELRLNLESIICIDYEKIVRKGRRQSYRLTSIDRKVYPWSLEERAGNVTQNFANQRLSAVIRTRVDNGPVIYPWLYGAQTSLDDMRLVLDDHAQS